MMIRRLQTWLLACMLLSSACATKVGTTQFLHSRFDFGFVERVAVLPLENLTGDTQAGTRVTRLLITELLASGAVDVVEPGEVQAAIYAERVSSSTPTGEQIVSLGAVLNVQAIIRGTVTQSELIRSGTVSVPVVTLDLHMLETETGAPVWAATHTERGSSASTKWLGTGAEPISETTRRCVRRTLRTLFE